MLPMPGTGRLKDQQIGKRKKRKKLRKKTFLVLDFLFYRARYPKQKALILQI
jgi:hypothetical protein